MLGVCCRFASMFNALSELGDERGVRMFFARRGPLQYCNRYPEGVYVPNASATVSRVRGNPVLSVLRANDGRDGYMLSWLTNAGRRRAGHVLALMYAFCAFAPSLALASSYCLARDSHAQSTVVHDHNHGAFYLHEADAGVNVATHDASANHDGRADQPQPAKVPRGATCCGLISVPGLPAGSAEILEPTSQRSSYLPEAFLRLRDNAPPRHYRPPIS